MDTAVLITQQWLNKTYAGKSGYTPVSEDGKTGWATIKRLTTALQIEMGISTPNGNFGPATSKAFENLSIGSTKMNQIYILQGALYCKGYNPGGFNGIFSESTKRAIITLQADAGLPSQDGVVNRLLMKALLTMDAFVILNWGGYHGDPNIREIQKHLNRGYISNECFARDIGLVPCDGIYGRSTNKALLYALQIEEGIPSPNGVFGPSTKSKCPVLSPGSGQSNFIRLLKYALYCNRFTTNGFHGEYDDNLKSAVSKFQKFCGLNVTGIADLQTWASLLVSTGDKTRKGTMCDCSTTITPGKAQTLVKNNYKSVGRYLTGRFKMTSNELKTIFSAGLRVFPIFESGGYKLSYFKENQGTKDANEAIKVASEFGFEEGTIIYFTVDFDALDGDVTSSVLPYFKEIHQVFNNSNSKYKVGIYGPRNVCSRVSSAGYSCSSFVCDMSSGFSGNLGYPLPKDWAIDQISTITVGNGENSIEIDNDISSGKDMGVNHVSPSKIIPDTFIKKGIVVNSVSFLNVRNGAGTSNAKIGTLDPNTEVFIVSEEGDWYKIKFNNGFGYVYKSYINITYSASEKTFISTGKVVDSVSFLNVRNGASTSNEKIGTLKPNDEVSIIAEDGNWYKIKFGLGYGYVHSDYININSKFIDNICVFKSKNTKLLDRNGDFANDLKWDDFKREEILAINPLFKSELDSSPENALFEIFKLMGEGFFSVGELEKVFDDMVDHFKIGNGTDYRNYVLNKHVMNHKSTKKYINAVKECTMKVLKKNNGDLRKLKFHPDSELNKLIQDSAHYPDFSSLFDIIGGLTITIHDTWANEVEVRNYSINGNKFSGTLHFNLYDHFGLDKPDVEKVYVKLPGFRAWFVLQHYKKFNGKYKPFVVVMEIDVPFEGEL